MGRTQAEFLEGMLQVAHRKLNVDSAFPQGLLHERALERDPYDLRRQIRDLLLCVRYERAQLLNLRAT